MQQIGYVLIDKEGGVTQQWGHVSGVHVSVPDVIALPNGDRVHCPVIGDNYSGYRLIERWLVEEPPSLWHRGASYSSALVDGKLIVTALFSVETDIDKRLVSEIKQQAGVEILRRYPDWKQRNMLARAVALAFKTIKGAALTPEEQAEIAALQAIWDEIKAIRSRSNEMEAQVSALGIDELVAWKMPAFS